MRVYAGLLALALSSVCARPAQAVEAQPLATPDTQVNLHLLGLLTDQLHVEVERRITSQWTGIVAPKVGLGGVTSGLLSEFFGRSFGLEVGGRWFPGEMALKGFFMQPMLSYLALYPKGGWSHLLGVHGRVGYQWLVANKVTFTLGAGVAYNALWLKESGANSFKSDAGHVRGFVPDGSFSIGLAF